MISYTSDRRAVGIAMLIVMGGLGALVALGVFDASQPREAAQVIDIGMDALPSAARAALARPAVRAYSNLGRRLPAARPSFYREHRMEGAEEGARIVRSEDGAVYFTRDNFRTVYRVR